MQEAKLFHQTVRYIFTGGNTKRSLSLNQKTNFKITKEVYHVLRENLIKKFCENWFLVLSSNLKALWTLTYQRRFATQHWKKFKSFILKVSITLLQSRYVCVFTFSICICAFLFKKRFLQLASTRLWFKIS